VPFTLAHPAAVLPLRGVRRLRTAPLVIGALAPDLFYYLPGGSTAHYQQLTHAFAHSYTIDLLLGYALLGAAWVLQRPLTALLSARARALCLRALSAFRRPVEWVYAAPAILIGVWTHLLWDSFTHGDGWVVHRMSALSAPLMLGPHDVPMYRVLQYLSSVIGLAVLVLWYRRLPAPPAATAPDAARSAAGPVLLLVAVAALLIGGVQGVERFAHTHSIDRALNVLLTAALTWFVALYLTAGTVLTLEHGEPHPPAGG
jgi:hypothetical protein